jgi:chloride channel 7
MEEDRGPGETPTTPGLDKHDNGVNDDNPEDPGSNGISSLEQPLLKRSNTLTASHLAMVGAKVSHIESLDYE